MVIGVDGNDANVTSRVGVGVYTFNLLNYFAKVSTANLKFVVYLKNAPAGCLPPESEYFRYQVVPGRTLWLSLFLPRVVNKSKNIDVFFSPAHYSPPKIHVPLVVTIHDLAYFYYPKEFLKRDLFKLKNWTRKSIQSAKKIICVSKSTKDDVALFYKTPEDKLEVIYNGYEKGDNNETKPADFTLSSKSYILFVSTLQPRKNIDFLVSAFLKIQQKNPELKLVIVGKKGWLYKKLFKRVKKLKIENSVLFTGFMSDAELTFLYKNALCLIHPSLYEGFGIPILEAMAYDCPVISSNKSSLPEIGGDAALYFDPTDEDDLVGKFNTLANDEKLQQALIQKGRERVSRFSWEKCASETLDVIKSAAV